MPSDAPAPATTQPPTRDEFDALAARVAQLEAEMIAIKQRGDYLAQGHSTP